MAVVRRVFRGLALLVALGTAFANRAALATGVAGDRLFPSTLLVEDTQNDDELELPTISLLPRRGGGDAPAGRDLSVAGQFSRLLTPDLALSVGSAWRHGAFGAGRPSGWDNLDLGLKYRALVDAPHELLVSTGLFYEVGGTGARRVGAERFDTAQPVVTFGKGWGDLPHDLDWLRPIAVTGAAAVALPTGSGPKLLRYGLSLQYSLYYLDRHTGIAVPSWAGSLIPLVEFTAETPVGRRYDSRTAMTAAPGIVWMGEELQLAVEALIPLDAGAGRGVGVIAQAHFFLDELLPSVFGKPLLWGD